MEAKDGQIKQGLEGGGGGGGGGGGLDLESRVKFPYIHESRNFFFRFHDSRG